MIFLIWLTYVRIFNYLRILSTLEYYIFCFIYDRIFFNSLKPYDKLTISFFYFTNLSFNLLLRLLFITKLSNNFSSYDLFNSAITLVLVSFYLKNEYLES